MSAATASLARTRHAIDLQMAPAPYPLSRSQAAGPFAAARAAASTWWRYEPARPGLERARALASKYAALRPWHFVAAAAAGGALVAIGCRWRLISVPGVLGRLARPSRLPSLLLSALAAVAPRRLQATRSEALAGAPWRTIDAT